MTDQGDSPSKPIAVGGWGDTPHRGIYASLLLVSMCLLTLEVSLTRFFSFTVWYHFAYLTISMALLGFGASGALVAAFPQLFCRSGHRVLVLAMVAGAVCTVAALFFLAHFPLDMNDIRKDPARFSASLLTYYAAVGLPFLLAGFAVSVPFAAYPQLMGRLYFWDLLGAALGCLVAVACVEVLGIPGLVIAAAGLLLGAAASLGLGTGRRAGPAALGAASVLLVALAAPIGNGLDIQVTPTKNPPALGKTPARADRYVKWTALNRVDAAGWAHPTRSQHWVLAGLMKAYRGPVPRVARVTYDGCNGSNIYPFSGSFDQYAMLDHHVLRTPYLIQERPNVLVIGVGGGIDMINAVKHGAAHVTGAELQPHTIYLLKERLRRFTGGFYDRPDVTLVASEGRHFVRRTEQTFDLIQITATDTFAAQATGAYVLAESYLYTVDAVEDYLSHLSEDGVLSMVVGDVLAAAELPPLATRLALIGYRALQRRSVERPRDHLMVIGALNRGGTARTHNILLKKTAFAAGEIRTIEDFAGSRGFEVLYAPATSSGEHLLGTVIGGSESERQAVLEQAWFRMDAVSDRDPFFYNVGRWRHLSAERSLLFLFPGSFVGQLVLLLMIVQSLFLGALLIVLPLLRGAREGLRAPSVASYLAYFLALGIGFMFIEISFVQSFVLFLGSPTHALSVTIFSLLLFSSIGSLFSTRYARRPEWALRRLAPVLAALVLLYALGLASVFDAFLRLAFGWRIAVAIAAQLPIGLALGMFMPLGIACVSRQHPRLVPWTWGINGIGSVVGTTLAVVLAMSWGFPAVALCAAALYLAGTALMLRAQRGMARG